jgi:hypothetical protein
VVCSTCCQGLERLHLVLELADLEHALRRGALGPYSTSMIRFSQ